MIFLYALLQAPIVPPRVPLQDAKPIAGPPSVEDFAPDPFFPSEFRDALREFLGRRHICADLATDPDLDAQTKDRRGFLRCEALQREEAEWRRVFKGDPAVEAALNEDPLKYRNPQFLSCFDCSEPNVRVRRSTQEGVEPASGKPVAVTMEISSERIPAILITARWGDVAARTIRMPAADLPGFDIATASLWLRASGEHEGLSITVRFGRQRGYCWNNRDDDRPEVNFWFEPGRVSASRQGWPACNSSHELFPVELVAAR